MSEMIYCKTCLGEIKEGDQFVRIDYGTKKKILEIKNATDFFHRRCHVRVRSDVF